MGCAGSREQRNELPGLKPVRKKTGLTYKVVLLGETFVGKTSLLNYILHNEKSNAGYSATIGFAFSSKTVALKNEETATLQLWDTSGQDTYRDLVSLYYRDSHAAILVFDYCSRRSLESLEFWMKQLEDRVNTEAIVIKIAGNKCDLKGTAL